jgi:drug/metabolite transporter (DMT)-like permease
LRLCFRIDRNIIRPSRAFKIRQFMSHANPSIVKASLWVSGWLLCMTTMAVGGRETASVISAFQVMELRAFIGMAMLTPLILMSGGFSAMKTESIWVHIVRNSVHYSGQFTWLVAVTLIPLAQVVSIEFTMPIWVAILAVMFLGEKMTQWKIAAIVLGLIGVWIIVRPGGSEASHGQLLALYAALAFAIAVVMVRSMTKAESVTRIIFWMLVIQGIIGLVPAIAVWKPVPAAIWPWIVLVAFCGTFSHFCLAHALRYADSTVVVPLDFLRVPMTALAGWLFYAEIIDIYTLIGALLIIGGNLLNLKKTAATK